MSRLIPMTLKQYAQKAHETSVRKGWWGPGHCRSVNERNFGEIIANIHSEVDEAWKEWVHNHGINETYYTMDYNKIPDLHITQSVLVEASLKWSRFQEYVNSDGSNYTQKPAEPTKSEVEMLVNAGILEPHGVPTELADILIRVFDVFDAAGLDADEVVQEKMAYNLTRQQRHGGKRA